jgi:acyl-CoA thioesterase I
MPLSLEASVSRRQFVRTLAGGAAALALPGCAQQEQSMLTVVTFGDSILDCGHYNPFGIHPGQLIVRNDDDRFPEFRGQDLSTRGPARLDHRAQDGATVASLPAQLRGLKVEGDAVALLTVGGNDLIRGLIGDTGPGIAAFARSLDAFAREVPIRPLLIGNVYDPTFGDDSRNFLYVEPAVGRANYRRLNEAIAEVAGRYGTLVDLHAHFLTGDPSWFTSVIEPSLRGASEVRRAFLRPLLD